MTPQSINEGLSAGTSGRDLPVSHHLHGWEAWLAVRKAQQTAQVASAENQRGGREQQKGTQLLNGPINA